MMADTVNWLAGIDWSRSTHQVCVVAAISAAVIGERSFKHSGADLAALCDWLLTKTGGSPGEIAVAIEVPHGPVVETLMGRGFTVYAINPKQLDRFRDRFTLAGAKDDRLDAHVMADALRTDRHRLHRLQPTEAEVLELREWSRMGDELKEEQVRLANRIGDQLWRYYPQALEVTDDVAANWFLELWGLAPTPAKAVRVAEKSVARILAAHRIRRIDAAEALRLLRQKPIAVAPGTAQAASAHIRALAKRLKLVNRQLKEVDRQLDALCARLGAAEDDEAGQRGEQRDETILRSLPGVGRIVVATLLSEASEPLRRRDYHALRPLCGVAPVTRQSGKRKIVLMRQACHPRLRHAVYHWARIAIQRDETSRAKYTALRKRGKSHGHALRAVADRLLAVACAMLGTGTLFDPSRLTKRMAAQSEPVPNA
jgi:transposase